MCLASRLYLDMPAASNKQLATIRHSLYDLQVAFPHHRPLRLRHQGIHRVLDVHVVLELGRFLPIGAGDLLVNELRHRGSHVFKLVWGGLAHLLRQRPSLHLDLVVTFDIDATRRTLLEERGLLLRLFLLLLRRRLRRGHVEAAAVELALGAMRGELRAPAAFVTLRKACAVAAALYCLAAVDVALDCFAARRLAAERRASQCSARSAQRRRANTPTVKSRAMMVLKEDF